jgi:hypothetical protein
LLPSAPALGVGFGLHDYGLLMLSNELPMAAKIELMNGVSEIQLLQFHNFILFICGSMIQMVSLKKNHFLNYLVVS